MTIESIIDMIAEEIRRAEMLHPGWPSDPIHGAAIVAEEAGELVQASIDVVYSNGDEYRMIEESIHTAATAIRLLLNFNKN